MVVLVKYKFLLAVLLDRCQMKADYFLWLEYSLRLIKWVGH